MFSENSKWPRYLIIVLVAANIFIWRSVLVGADIKETELYFLAVGQGDSELIILPGPPAGGVKVMIDGGPGAATLDALAEVLPPHDRYIDLLVISHPQLDHFGGFIDILKNYQVGAVIDNGRRGTAKAYADLEKAIETNGAKHVVLKGGDAIKYQDAIFKILAPTITDLTSEELNDTTLVILLEQGRLSALYTGDIDAKTEEKLANKYDLSATILKVSHHGSRFSSSATFLKQIKPEVAIVEVGKNSYGHPTAETLNRLANVGSLIFRTDRDGTVKIIFDGEALKVYH